MAVVATKIVVITITVTTGRSRDPSGGYEVP